MKNKLKALTLAVMVTLALTYTSCKKSDTAVPDNTSQYTAEGDDANRVNNETDAVTNDANASIEASPAYSTDGRVEGNNNILPLPCDANITYAKDSLDTTLIRTITIHYNGANCAGNRTRVGNVVITFPVGEKWKTPGAWVTITYDTLTITRKSDNATIIINGSKTYTNVTGGLLKNLSNGNTITHTLTSSDMSITFDNGTTRTWNIGRQRVFSYNNGVVVTETGLGTDGALIWGTNRFGTDFSYDITQPLVVEQSCEFQLVGGQVTFTGADFKGLDKTLTVTFGLDAQGNPVTTCPGLGNFYWEAQWTNAKGKTLTVIHPY